MTKSASFWGGISVCLLVFLVFSLTTARPHHDADHGAAHDTEHHEAAEHGEHGGH